MSSMPKNLLYKLHGRQPYNKSGSSEDWTGLQKIPAYVQTMSRTLDTYKGAIQSVRR